MGTKPEHVRPPQPLKEKCDYCGSDLKSKSPKKRFCGDICRIYFRRKLNSKYCQPKLPKDEPVLDTPEPQKELPALYQITMQQQVDIIAAVRKRNPRHKHQSEIQRVKEYFSKYGKYPEGYGM